MGDFVHLKYFLCTRRFGDEEDICKYENEIGKRKILVGTHRTVSRNAHFPVLDASLVVVGHK